MTKEAFEKIAEGLKEALKLVRSGAIEDRFKYLSAEPRPSLPDGYSAPLDTRTTRELRETKS